MFKLKVEPLPADGMYKLTQSVIIEGVKIEAGFTWNGASIPDFLWPLVGSPFDAQFMAPSLVHDWLYHTGEIPRSDADKLFRKLLIHNGVSRRKAKIMYKGVHYFGAPFYNYKNEVA